MKPILFISHDGQRTGAPMVLLNLCRWMARHHPRPFEVVLCNGGDLEREFAALAPTSVIGFSEEDSRAEARLRTLSERVAQGDFSLIYANTIETAEVLAACPTATTPVITHVHELAFRIRHQTGVARFDIVTDRTDRFVAVSAAVRDNLVHGHGFDPAEIDLVHEFIDTGCWGIDRSAGARVRQQLAIPDSALVVGGAGTLDWRKGPDLFVQIAGAVSRARLNRPVHWVWVGGLCEEHDLRIAELRHDAERMGVDACVHFVGEQANPAAYFAAFDLFLLSSREDPYPLVTLEAAASGVPVVCFDRAGGAPEFVEDDCGVVAPYLDVAATAGSIARLLADDAERQACGERARAKVRARHDVSMAASRLAQIIESTIATGPTGARLTRMALRAAVPKTIAVVLLYQMASDYAATGETERARTLFAAIVDAAGEVDPALAGKACYKLATLAERPLDATRWCDRALTLLPTHRAARALRETLLAAEPIHG